MIDVLIERNHQGTIIRYEISGHANAADHGEDIVCAAISVLSQTTLLALHEIVKIETNYQVRSGFLSCELPKMMSQEQRQQTELLLETMILGIRNLMISYSEYISLHDKEV
ncbi:ribosomal-processing cysteine protease Prp [Alkaliphilus crotonatoxidans]